MANLLDQLAAEVGKNGELTEAVTRRDEQLSLATELLQEALTDRMLRLEDIGWRPISGYAQQPSGVTLESLQLLSLKLRELAATNPWHINGARLRHSYTFGSGMTYLGLGKQAQSIVDDPHNKEQLFSVAGYAKANKAVFTDGQFIVIKRLSDKKFFTPHLDRIAGAVLDPEDESTLRYIKRLWSNGTETWVPLARYKNSLSRSLPKDIGGTLVDKDHVAYVKRANLQSGWTWGIPDSLGAMIFTLAYSGYLQNNATLVEALSKFAWSLTRTTPGGVDKAAAAVAAPGVGTTAISGPGGAVANVGVPSAQVNMSNGQPLVAAVAASFGVPVIALIESPGAGGGSYGTAQTLDAPTQKGFESLQGEWLAFYTEIIHDLAGGTKGTVNFASLDVDPPYRKVTSLATLVELGVVWPDEARAVVMTLLDIPKIHDGLPPKPKAPAPNPNGGTVVSKQGVSAAVAGNGATTNPGGETDNTPALKK